MKRNTKKTQFVEVSRPSGSTMFFSWQRQACWHFLLHLLHICSCLLFSTSLALKQFRYAWLAPLHVCCLPAL